jgi:RNA polymerase sigma-70 factor, ECF subfamily
VARSARPCPATLSSWRPCGGATRRPSAAWSTAGILLNQARSHGRRERRSLPFAALRRRAEEGGDDPAVDPARFQGRRGERPGWWAEPPARWSDPEERLSAAEARAALRDAIGALPPRQRDTLVMRDVLGLSAEEACGVLGASEGNQRVLLHRARAKVRSALEEHMAEGRAAG